MGTAKHDFPEIDGLRALAITSVVAFHLGLPGSSIGWAGVQLFFCISGFLITKILLATKDMPLSGYLRRFFVRRALRILPAYYGYLAVALLLRWHLGGNVDGWPYFVFYINNYYQAAHAFQHSMLIDHLWTLAIEEQFYVLWPFIVYWLNENTLWRLCVSMVFLAPLIRWVSVLLTHNIHWEYASLPASMDMLAMGAMYALQGRNAKLGKHAVATWITIGFAALCMLIGSIGYSNVGIANIWIGSAKSHFLFTSVGITCIGLIILAQNAPPIMTILRAPPLVWLGKISYGLYLLHPLVFAICSYLGMLALGDAAKVGYMRVGLIACQLILLIGFATLSFYYFENWFLKLKGRLAP